MMKTSKRHYGAMSSIHVPNFINVSVTLVMLWPYNRGGTPEPPLAGRTSFPKVITTPYGKILPWVKKHITFLCI